MNRQRALGAIHVAALLFGLTGIFGELIQADAMAITAGRAGFAVIALWAVIRYQGQSPFKGLAPRNLGVLVLAGTMLAVHWVTFFIAVKIAGVAVATLGFASFPAFITLSEWLVFRERISREEWLILALVTLGLILVTPSFDFRDEATVGLAWAVASGFSFAAFTLINRRAATHIPAQQVACWENLVVVVLTLPLGFSSLTQLDALNWLWVALLGVLCTALSHYLLVSSLMVLKARSAGIIIALEPVYAIFFAAVLFAQYPSLRALIGGAIMIAAIVWSGLRQPARKKTQP
jgi:drug/metabolite transporter (DMT)-like permease